MKFAVKDKIFEITPGRPIIMGVLNVTPDSFYDGGRYSTLDAATSRAEEMMKEGADIIDIGGESTRPGAESVSFDEELKRVVPAVQKIVSILGAVVSVDTSKADVASAAVAAGASIINDVTALGRDDGRIAEIAAASGAGLILMHMKGEPRTMQRLPPRYGDVVAEIKEYLSSRVAFAVSRGVSHENIAVDPGIGFGKTLEHNVELIRRLREFSALGRPALVGASRKSFIVSLLGLESPDERLYGTLAAHMAAVMNGASIIRVHDVLAHAQFFRALEALKK
ncbi:MAG: dihydropteroate synthase [Endomicrobiia bacterium]|nr:dihydropteroate synthase [Endomicrobiia bacterium]